MARSVSRGYRLVAQDLGRMAMIEGLFIEVVSSVIQRPSKALDPIIKDRSQFRPLNFVEKSLNASKKNLWSSELLLCTCAHPVAERPETRRCQVRTISGIVHLNNVNFGEKVFRDF
jgi:hypothetical protein